MDRREMLRRLDAGEDPLDVEIEIWQEEVDDVKEDIYEKRSALCEAAAGFCDRCLIGAKGYYACDGAQYFDCVLGYALALSEKNGNKAHLRAMEMLEFLIALKKKMTSGGSGNKFDELRSTATCDTEVSKEGVVHPQPENPTRSDGGN